MLEEIKNSYFKEANHIPNWDTINKNDLVNTCVDNKNNPVLYTRYLSAVILRYWSNIGKYYNSSKASGFTIEDCYTWYIEAILRALDKEKWRDPSSSMYNDPNGPDKIINRCIYSQRQLNYYLSNRAVRKANFGAVNLDKLSEEVGDHVSLLKDDDCEKDLNQIYLNCLITNYFKKDIIKGIILNSICYDNCFTETKDKINFKFNKLSTNLLLYNTNSIYNLADKYNINKELIVDKFKWMKSVSKTKLNKTLKEHLIMLAQDKELKEFLCG